MPNVDSRSIRPAGAHRRRGWRRIAAAWNRFWRATTPRGAAELYAERKCRHGV